MSDTLSISEASSALNVSEASIRNWIKTGYLEFKKETGITRQSLDNFSKNIAGKEKLNKRANKSQLDQHSHEALLDNIQRIMETSGNYALISDKYENGLSNTHRNNEGILNYPHF